MPAPSRPDLRRESGVVRSARPALRPTSESRPRPAGSAHLSFSSPATPPERLPRPSAVPEVVFAPGA